MFHFLLFIVVFIIVYFAFRLFFEDALKREKKSDIKEVGVLKKLFNLDEKKIIYKELLKGVSIINAFIIGVTVVVVDIIGIEKVYWLFVALIVIVLLIIVCYYIYGKLLQKKWGEDKNGI